MSIRVVLADDSDIARKAISQLLESDPEVELIAEAASFKETERFVSKLRPQVVVMDIHMRDGNPMTHSQLKLNLAGTCLVAISFATDEETKVLADDLGAVVLLDKMNLVAELLPAIKGCVGSARLN